MEEIKFDDWLKWAKEKKQDGQYNIHPLVTSFIERAPGYLTIGKLGTFFIIDARTWEAVSDSINAMIKEKEKWIDPEGWEDIDPAGNIVKLDDATIRRYTWMKQNHRKPKTWNNPDDIYDIIDIDHIVAGYMGISMSYLFATFVVEIKKRNNIHTEEDLLPPSFTQLCQQISGAYYFHDKRCVLFNNPKYKTEGKCLYIGAAEYKSKTFKVRALINEDFDDYNDPIVASYESLKDLLLDGWAIQGWCYLR